MRFALEQQSTSGESSFVHSSCSIESTFTILLASWERVTKNLSDKVRGIIFYPLFCSSDMDHMNFFFVKQNNYSTSWKIIWQDVLDLDHPGNHLTITVLRAPTVLRMDEGLLL